MSALVDATLEWAAAAGPPNAVFVLALLTAPAKWSRRALEAVRARLGGA